MISIQGIAAAITGRRIAANADHGETSRELAACRVRLATAAAEIAVLRDTLTDAVRLGDEAVRIAKQHRSEVDSLRAANRGLIRLAEGREPVTVQAAPPGLRTPPANLATADRRNAIRLDERVRELEQRVDELLAENEQFLKALAG